jgi:hypothetical protein
MVKSTSIKRICVFAIAIFYLAWPASIFANQTIFNVPSAEVLAAKEVYLESDWYFRSWETDNGKIGVTYFRGMVGTGCGVEVGAQTGAYNLIDRNEPFFDATVKWKPVYKEFASGFKTPAELNIYFGTLLGVGLMNEVKGKGRNLTYGAAALRLPNLRTRLGVGPYFSTKYWFGELRGGALASLEQPVPHFESLVIAADWFSGDGGYLSTGMLFSR